MKSEQMTLSVKPDTKARLKKYAEEKHTNVSQLITQWIWSVELKEEKEKEEASKLRLMNAPMRPITKAVDKVRR